MTVKPWVRIASVGILLLLIPWFIIAASTKGTVRLGAIAFGAAVVVGAVIVAVVAWRRDL